MPLINVTPTNSATMPPTPTIQMPAIASFTLVQLWTPISRQATNQPITVVTATSAQAKIRLVDRIGRSSRPANAAP